MLLLRVLTLHLIVWRGESSPIDAVLLSQQFHHMSSFICGCKSVSISSVLFQAMQVYHKSEHSDRWCFLSLVPRPRPTFRRLQYGKSSGRGPGIIYHVRDIGVERT